MVGTSSNTGVKKAQLVAYYDGRVIVPVYDYSTFLGQYFKKIPNIKKFHHFRFSKNETLLLRVLVISGTSFQFYHKRSTKKI